MSKSSDGPTAPPPADVDRKFRIAKWFPDLGDDKIAKLRAFHSELIFFNGRMNLISPKTEAEADEVHIADAILAARSIFSSCNEQTVYDLGSGNGVPGIVMAILEPKRKFFLVDADARKIEFMKHCVARLQLANCATIHGRLEDLDDGSVKCGVSRAMASISKMLLFARKATAPGSVLYHMKSDSWAREAAEIPSQVLAHWEPRLVSGYSLPETGVKLFVVMTQKK